MVEKIRNSADAPEHPGLHFCGVQNKPLRLPAKALTNMNKRTRILFLTMLVYIALTTGFIAQYTINTTQIWLILMVLTPLAGLLVAYWRDRQWLTVAKPVSGTVRAVTAHSHRGPSYYRYQVEYEHGGTAYTHTYNDKSRSQVGSLVPLLMHPMRPNDVRGPSEKWINTLVWGILAGVSLLLAFYVQ
jgi:hypothetical protein